MKTAPRRATAWAAAADDLSITIQIALDDLADRLSGFYDVGYADGEFHAFRLAGGPLITAPTVAGLDSAIRADWQRQRQARGFPR